MKRETVVYSAVDITTLIIEVRGKRVILDADLAGIYGIPTKRLNEQVRRNTGRFPPDFAFVLTEQEVTNLKSQFATSSPGLSRSQFATGSRPMVGDESYPWSLLSMVSLWLLMSSAASGLFR